MTLTVETGERRMELAPGTELMFGRDQTCDVCLGPGDLGISRIAGRISHEGGYWVVTNLSRKRALHVADEAGFAVPLPIAADGVESRRAVDRSRMTILVAGDSFTHALVLTPAKLPKAGTASGQPADPLSTRTQRPQLTDQRREVLVAMAAGYLLPYPRYDPHPRAYQDMADLLGLDTRHVIKQVEETRQSLVEAGVPSLKAEGDARRALCEWLLVLRLIGPADLDWLQSRIDASRLRQRRTAEPIDVLPEPGLPTTTHPILDEITRIAERTARHVAPPLLARLRQHYGDDWLAAVNANRPRHGQARRQHLRDYRLCLSILANDPATHGWISEDCRRSARELNRMANMAAHRRTLAPADIERAREHSNKIRNGIPNG